VTNAIALAEARRRDVARRRQRVHQTLAEMRAQAAEITISSVAARARVHRSFIHRHPDLRAAVIAAAEDPATSGPAAASTVSRRSLLADNANLRDRARRLEQHARSLEDRLSELLGTQVSQRTGLSPPSEVATLNDQVEALRQENLDLRRCAEDHDEELAAAREANRRLMTELNKARS
jgi:murein DD-endopeptidase MepM/ murein hydrolase activator NlpD